MNGQCLILWIKFINSIMIQQMAVNLGNFNQISTDYGDQIFLTTYQDNETSELTLVN